MKDSWMPINAVFLQFIFLSPPFFFSHRVLGLLKGDQIKPKNSLCAQRFDIAQ